MSEVEEIQERERTIILMNKTIYTTKRGEYNTFTALILEPNTREVQELTYFESMDELKGRVQEEWGDIERLSPKAFQEELDKRAIHTPEMVTFLQNNPEGDLSRYYVYGSSYRPISSMWARIDGAIYPYTSYIATGYHSYVVVPKPLDKEVIDRYQLVFVSRPEEVGK
jgi:hypothetical protein